MARIFGEKQSEANTTDGVVGHSNRISQLIGEALAPMGPVLKQSWVHAELLKFIRIGLLCVQDRRLSRQAHHVFCGYYVSKRFGTTSSTNPTCSFCWPNCRKAGSILTRCRNLLC
ncbi:hypothetical protein WN943_012272 [Citrus x changshan-huyou]